MPLHYKLLYFFFILSRVSCIFNVGKFWDYIRPKRKKSIVLGQKCQLGCLFFFSFHNIYYIFSQTPTDVKMYSSDIHLLEIHSAYDIRLHIIIFMTYDLLFTSQHQPYNNTIMVVHTRTQVTTTGCSCGRCRIVGCSDLRIVVRQLGQIF